MCGICGKLNFDHHEAVEPRLIQSMLSEIRHRGPDDEGLYLNPGIGLGHRRLSIIDLTTGHQPLCNEDGTVWIVFNGEIYNFLELRQFLIGKGHIFKTQSDTEVIVHLYEELGPACLEQLRGMFAFAIWDQKTKTLFLARDRVGIKPLYYFQNDTSLVFGSEIKAILADPLVPREIAPEIIHRFLTFHYLPGEETLFKGVRKLPPGWYLRVQDGRSELRQYWDLHFPMHSRRISLKNAQDELLGLLAEAVKLHMIADVPVGVLLSGGVDSTAVLSLAAEATDREISSYTIGFADSGVADERPYARLAAQTFGSRHRDMTITAGDFSEFLPQYVWHMEEPVCEPPAIAMYYVSKLAKQHVKVLLSGEGGDEAFAGYSNYRNLLWLERLKRLLLGFNGPVSRTLTAANSWLNSPLIAKYAPLVNAQFPEYYYSRTSNPFGFRGNGLRSLYSPEYFSSINHEETLQPLHQLQAQVRGLNPLNAMLYIDTKTWLPDDLLLKADKMTMANSVELRVPLLDHKILEFAAALPTSFKVRGFQTKFLAKRALGSRIPKPILQRKKVGFPVPYETWLKRDLRDWVQDLLVNSKSANRGYFDPTAVRELLAHPQGGEGASKEIFSLLTLETWHRTFLDTRPVQCGKN